MDILFYHYYRVLGFTGIVRTDCNRTTELLTHKGLEWPIYVNPIVLLIIFWMSTSEVRFHVYRYQARNKVCFLLLAKLYGIFYLLYLQSKRNLQSKQQRKKGSGDRNSSKRIRSVSNELFCYTIMLW